MLFLQHSADVLAYALRRTDAASAEDVVAEVFLIAWRRADRVPHTEPVLWLYSVARRVLANQRRAARRRDALVALLGPLARRHAAEPEPAGSPLTEALARLRPDDRELLMLTAWEGLDAGDAAVVLGCTTQAVHTRLHRARGRLQAELDREIPEVCIA
jgi:RNA polymerase sigma-70 factor (ECF subfamily)